MIMKFATAKDSYNQQDGVDNYLKFLASSDGGVFKEVLYEAVRGRLPDKPEQTILDAACGPGWLTAKLAAEFPNTQGLDGSQPFLQHARERCPDLKFIEGDLNSTLPYSDAEFDVIVMSLAAHDVEDQVKTFLELYRILKPSGQLILTITNPYYAYPVGAWKRGILGRLLGRKPRLQLRPYHELSRQPRDYKFYEKLQSYFVPLSEHINNARAAGFTLEFMHDMESAEDSKNYNLKYRLHRFPIFLLLDFTKD